MKVFTLPLLFILLTYYTAINTNAEEFETYGNKSTVSNGHPLNWHFYTNETFGIKFYHPPYLEPIKISLDTFDHCNSGENINLLNDTSFLSVHISKEFTNSTINQQINDKLSCYTNAFQEFSLIEEDRSSTIAGLIGYKLLYTFKDQEGFHKVLEIGSKSGDNIYSLIFDTSIEDYQYDDNFDKSLLDIQSIVDSFQLLGNELPSSEIQDALGINETTSTKQTELTSLEKDLRVYEMTMKNKSVPLKYHISGGKIITIIPDISTDSIFFDVLISTNSSGILTIELPRSLIDTKKENIEDEEYDAFLNPPLQKEDPGGDFAKVDEIENNHQSRVLAIEFRNDTQYITIIGERNSDTFGLPRYVPNVALVGIADIVSPDSAVRIIANVTDIFGKIDNVVLKYSIDYDGDSYMEDEIPMQLVWGNQSQGSYLATIPPIIGYNATVDYLINVTDDLGYTSDIVTGHFVTEPNDEEGPELRIIRPPIDQYLNNSNNIVSALVVDYGSGIKNVTLEYYTSDNKSKHLTNVMKLIEGNNWYGLYRFSLPPANVNINYNYSVIAYDNAENGGKEENTIVQSSANPEGFEMTRIMVDMNMDIDPLNLTLKDDISINGRFPIQNYPLQDNPSRLLSSESTDLIKIINARNNTEATDYFEIPIIIQPNENPLSRLQFTSNSTIASSIKLIGEPSRFPFDSYYANIIVATPFKNIQLNSFSPSFSSNTNLSWVPSVHKSLIDPEQVGIFYGNSTHVPLEDTKKYFFPSTSDINPSDHTFINFQIDLQRTNTIAIVIIPMLGIFYLLGAIFIFENSADNIGNRLALTLGIFALIFTLPEIINSLKPATSALTIADSLLGIIIIASIAFTITSVMSSSPSVHKLFPKHHGWIDWIVFVIVSGIVLLYSTNFPTDIIIWLIPVIIFGLGYGLLFRTLGIKINKPLVSIFKHGSK